MVTQQRIADELRTERERLTSYLEALPEGAWDKESLCEGWTVKEVMAHAIGIAADVANRRLDGVGTAEKNQEQVDARRDRSPTELLDEWREQGALLEQGILELDDTFWTAPYTENFNVGQALQRMVEDIWVHGHDIRIPLGDELVGGPGLRSTLEVATREWQVRLPKFAPEVGSLEIDTSELSDTVKSSGSAAVKIAGDPITLALVSTGRIPLEEAASSGKLSVEPSIPGGLSEAINIYGPA
jgi:uncharacterized protein (TIGR03083 family)